MSREDRNEMLRARMREAAEYIEDMPRFSSKNTPEVTKAYLRLLGEPDRDMKIIHVAGTNGKGSVCNYLESICLAAGYSTGLFISPHLSDIRERLRLNGQMIPEEAFIEIFDRIRDLAGRDGLPHPSYFEFFFLMMMAWMGEEKPDLVILETGVGGRLDATNTVREKLLTVITRIGLDHTDYLGETLEAVAGEKAGILRRDVPLVCLDTPEPAYQAILEAARQAGAPVTALGEDNWRDTKLIENLIDFSFRYGYHCTVCAEEGVCIHARLRGTGLYQRENASLAAAAALLLADRGLEITADQIRLGLEQAFWAGRMEEKRPGLWLDGAHNPDGIRAFLETVRAMELPDGASRHLLFSAVRDKRYGQMLRMLAASGLFRTVLAVPMSNYRSVTLDEMKQTVEDTLRELPADRRPLYRVMDSVEEALEQMLRQKKPGDLCFVCGSLYLVGIVEDLTVI